MEKKRGNQTGRVFACLFFDIFVNDKNAQQTKGVLPEQNGELMNRWFNRSFCTLIPSTFCARVPFLIAQRYQVQAL